MSDLPTRPLPLVTPVRVICAILLVAPFVALLWVNSYARLTPAFIGIPFFYWYQLMWVVLSALMTGLAYVLFTREEKQRKAFRAQVSHAQVPGGEGE
ncbi:membrane protein implicated in regulation of membrane protease activity [Streptacidiphilus sp. MAP12-20]|uniref:DUF3311 domain-containing protein n=1 Tax=Streptacidiphilus sp. MAP12-20 TaxID=3156299 RepID=UPI003515D333